MTVNSTEDLEAPKANGELVKTDYPVIKQWASRDNAIAEFKDRDEPYKLEITWRFLMTAGQPSPSSGIH